MNEPIYNLESASEWCRVSRETILSWIDRGMRAFPLGESSKYRSRDYLIRETWLIDFWESHSQVARPTPKTPEVQAPKTTSGRRGRRPAPDKRYPLGPCPV